MRSVLPRWIAAAAILAALVLACCPTPGSHAVPTALADAPPAVTLALLNASNLPASDPLPQQVTLKATAVPPAASIASINFEYAPADTGNWSSLGMNPTFAGGLPPYTVALDTTTLTDGLYDFRAELTETDGTVQESPTIRDQLVANQSPYVTLASTTTGGTALATGAPLRGTIGISGSIVNLEESQGLEVDSVSLQLSPANAENWTTLSTEPPASGNNSDVSFAFDTTTVPDGTYDLRAVPTDNFGDPPDASIPIRGIVIDNTPPDVTLISPGSPLTGKVTLSVNATDAGSGVTSVQYERAAAGTNAWTQIGSSGEAPYSDTVDTSAWADGAYSLRAVATDHAGNVATSNVVTVTASNPSPPPPTPVAISGLAAPVHHVTMLGAVAGSPTGEAWAYGYTNAPPASVNGSPLPYTAEGDQFVLLSHSNADGWQIADVLRNADDSGPFALLPADEAGTDAVEAAGAMAANGEAWLWIYEPSDQPGVAPVYGLFHRQENVDGGAFVLDPSGTQALANLGANSLFASLRLGLTSGGQVYGIFVNPPAEQQPYDVSVSGPSGQPVTISESLQYALLQDGSWQVDTAALPPTYTPEANDTINLEYADVSGPGTGWATLAVSRAGVSDSSLPLLLGRFDGGDWTYVQTGLDALDLTGSVANPNGLVSPTGLKADGDSVWIGAHDTLPTAASRTASGNVVALYDGSSGAVTQSWCTLPVVNSCDQPLDGEHPAAVPDAVFDAGGSSDALSLQNNTLDVYANGAWSSVAAPGYTAGDDTFTDLTDGWLGGQSAIGQLSTQASTSLLASWPVAVRAPLTGVALPPGSDGSTDAGGALAVGFDGSALLYSGTDGWIVRPTPPQAAHLYLTSVAFDGPSSAFAVGQYGEILHWDGNSWSEDPQSISLTENQLNSVAFDAAGQGWAVGEDGTILHYDGQSWSIEAPPPVDAETDITSVAVAGSDVFAIAGGNLIVRQSDGSWQAAPASLLPSDPAPTPGSLRLVSGLPDGGAAIAGVSVVLERQSAGASFNYSNQPLEGIAVAVSAFRGGDGAVRAAVSIAPPAASPDGTPTTDIGGYPSGDGELMLQTPDGWQDLSRAQPAGDGQTLPPDGEVKPDPVLGVATSPDGSSAWAVGGYDGTVDSVGQGSTDPLASRETGWQTASLWRYDVSGSVTAPDISPSTPNLPATPDTVSFAFFSTPMCQAQCSATPDAQPDTNLAGAIGEINSYATQPGGPVFAMLGGNAVGPSNTTDWKEGNGAQDFAQLPSVLAPLQVPLFAAYGPLDPVPTEADPAQSWSNAFAQSPAPFGNGEDPNGITPVSAGAAQSGTVSRYYSFDATQNGATLRVIVLDNSQGSLDSSDVGQTAWLNQQLAAAAGIPTVVIAALPLYGSATTDGSSVAAALINAGVLAVFTSDVGLNGSQLNQVHQLSGTGSQTIPEYEGATLGYQVSANDGVVWYDVSVNTQTHTANVNAVPLVQSLALDPLRGQVVARSLTLQFQAIGRRPPGSLVTGPEYGDTLPGYDNYVGIPASGCSTCVTPSYQFSSSNPEIGTFVQASGPDSPYPALNASGHPIPSSQSGLFCAYNAGTTTVSITAGLMTASLPVTVQAGGYGSPCGTVALTGVLSNSQRIEGHAAPAVDHVSASNPPAPPPPPPPPAPAAAATSPAPVLAPPPPTVTPVSHPPPAPVPRAPSPAPRPPATPIPAFTPTPAVNPAAPALAILPPPTPAVEPIPPGGATAPGVSQSPSTAERKEKARKHASQSAYTLLAPAGSDSSIAWWYEGGLGVATVLALLLTAQAVRPRGRASPARSYVRRR